MKTPCSTFIAKTKTEIFENLQTGKFPGVGKFSETLLEACRVMGTPQMGTTVHRPQAFVFEYIYRDHLGNSTIFPVEVEAPDRVVFMPVPDWVIESIWQGDIDGSFCFAWEAEEKLAALTRSLEPEPNEAYFGRRQAKRRE